MYCSYCLIAGSKKASEGLIRCSKFCTVQHTPRHVRYACGSVDKKLGETVQSASKETIIPSGGALGKNNGQPSPSLFCGQDLPRHAFGAVVQK